MIDIEQLKALEQAATPGPWAEGAQMVVQADQAECVIEMVETEDDAKLIVAARNALPELLALLEEALRLANDAFHPVCRGEPSFKHCVYGNPLCNKAYAFLAKFAHERT